MAIPPIKAPDLSDLACRLGWVTKKQARKAHERAETEGAFGPEELAIVVEIAGLSSDVVEKVLAYEPAPGFTPSRDLVDQGRWRRALKAFAAPGAGAKDLAELRAAAVPVRQAGTWTSALYDRARKGESLETFGATHAVRIGEPSHGIDVWTLSAEAGSGVLMWIRFNTNVDGVLFELNGGHRPSATYEWIDMQGMTVRYLTFKIDNLQWTRTLPPDEAAARAHWNAFTTDLRGVFAPLGVELATSERDASPPKS